MMNKVVIIALFAFVAVVNSHVLPAAYISPYASTYNAHTINHAVAAPVVHAGPAKLIASPYATPFAASPYIAHSAPYSSLPYSSLPYSSLPFSSPYSYNPYAYSNYFL